MAKMLNAEEYTITMDRGDILRLRQACTAVYWEFRNEAEAEETSEERKRIAKGSAEMWKRIRDEVDHQIEEQDKKQDWYRG